MTTPKRLEARNKLAVKLVDSFIGKQSNWTQLANVDHVWVHRTLNIRLTVTAASRQWTYTLPNESAKIEIPPEEGGRLNKYLNHVEELARINEEAIALQKLDNFMTQLDQEITS